MNTLPEIHRFQIDDIERFALNQNFFPTEIQNEILTHFQTCTDCFRRYKAVLTFYTELEERNAKGISDETRRITDKALKRSRQRRLNILPLFLERKINVIAFQKFKILRDPIESLLYFLFVGHRLATLTIAVLIILVCSITIWRFYFIRTQISMKPEQYTQSVKDTASPKGMSKGLYEDTQIPHPQAVMKRYSHLVTIERVAYIPMVLMGEEPSEVNMYFEEGMRHYNLKNYSEAIASLRRSVQIDPKNFDSQFFLGLCFLLSESTDLAMKHLQQAGRLGSNTTQRARAHYFLGNSYLLKENSAEAMIEFEKVIALHGDYKTQAENIINDIKIIESK